MIMRAKSEISSWFEAEKGDIGMYDHKRCR
jgi:hypothetical protein